MKGRLLVRNLLLVFAIFSLGYLVGKEVGMRAAPRVPGDSSATADAPPRRLVAYYFHGSKRCSSCNTIEALSHETVTRDFAAELAAGRLAWKVVNKDEPWNSHVIERYGLTTSSVVLSDEVHGVEQDHAVLKRVWDYVDDKDKLQGYVRAAIQMYLATEDDGEDDEEDDGDRQPDEG